jgi:tetratricopeptide (TPR) repeat protein
MRASVAFVGLALLFASSSASAECPRRDPSARADAVRLANEADKLRAVNIDDAIAKYEEATKLEPDDDRLWWKLALAYEKKEDWRSVVRACRAAEAADERAHGAKTRADTYARHGYALARIAASGAGAWSDAIAPLERATSLDPNLADAFGELGSARAHTDDDAGAIRAWMQAIAKAPDRMHWYVALADAYRRWMFFDHAERVLVAGLAFAKDGDKDLYDAHALLGDVHMTKGNATRAVADYEAAIKACASSCADRRDAPYKLGVAYAALTPPRKAEAIQQLQRFNKSVCKGALARRYEDACVDAMETMRRMGGTLP